MKTLRRSFKLELIPFILLLTILACQRSQATPVAGTQFPLITEMAAPSPSPSPTPSPAFSIPIRGVRVDIGGGFEDDAAFVSTLRDLNVNWVELVLWPQVTTEGKVFECWTGSNVPNPSSVEEMEQTCSQTENIMVDTIRKWHKLGFKVYLIVYHERFGQHHAYGYGVTGRVDEILRQTREIAIRWAKIAEQNGVEMYAPRKELQFFVGPGNALQWDRDILPEVRAVYSGDLVQGAFQLYIWDRNGKTAYTQEPLPTGVKGYDYLGVDFYGSDVDTLEELAALYTRFLLSAEEIKNASDMKGVVFEELGFPHHGIEAFWNDPSLTANEVMSQYYDTIFSLGIGRIDGFFPWAWQDGTYQLVGNRAAEAIRPSTVIKQYYAATALPVLIIQGLAIPVATLPPITFEVSEPLLVEDFSDGSRWDMGSIGSVQDGVLTMKGEGIVKLNDPSSEAWEDYVFRAEFKPLEGEIGFNFRRSGGEYAALVKPVCVFHLLKFTRSEGTEKMEGLREAIPVVEYNKWHTIIIYVKDNAIQIFIDDTKITEFWDPSPLPVGGIGIGITGTAEVDNVVVEELR